MHKIFISLFSVGFVITTLLVGAQSVHAATTTIRYPSVAQRIKTAWQGVGSVNYAVAITDPLTSGSAVKAWYGTWENNSPRMDFNAYVFDSTTSTPVLEFIQNSPNLYVSVSKINPSSTFAFLQKGWVQVTPTTTTSTPASNPATVLGIGDPVNQWWTRAQLGDILGSTVRPMVNELSSSKKITWGKMVNDVVDDREVYRLPFSIPVTIVNDLGLTVLLEPTSHDTAVRGQLYIDKKTFLPYRLSSGFGNRHISLDLSNYNTAMVIVPTNILTMSQAVSSTVSSTR